MTGELAILLDAARLIGAGAITGLGLVLTLGGSLGQLRFPDFYTRLHAQSAADGAGAVTVLLGLALASGDPHIVWRLLLLAGLVAVTTPTLGHMGANAAHVAGLAPVAGPFARVRGRGVR